MLYMHYCKDCDRIHMLNGHRMICPRCTNPLTELKISYLDYIEMDLTQREILRNDCRDEQKLSKMNAKYRMYKYSKWYKKLQKENAENLPVTVILSERAKKKCG